MTRPRLAAALGLLAASGVLAPGALAQEPAARSALVGAAPAVAEQAPAVRLFEIHSGKAWLDGNALPPEAVPEAFDLSGLLMRMEFSGSLTPVIESASGELFVLENERLVPMEEAEKAGNAVYILGEYAVAPEAASADRLQPVVAEAYRRQLSDADRGLYAKMQREARMEGEILSLARRARGLPPGEAYDALAVDLRQRLRDLFDLKQEIRLAELDRAEDELRALRAVITERGTMREAIVDHRFRELLGEAPVDR